MITPMQSGDGAEVTYSGGNELLSTDPAVADWDVAMRSTSAQLREARAEAAEMRAQLLRATERNEVLRKEIGAIARELSRTENELKARQTELSAAYCSLGDVEAQRDRLRNDLANATIARHAAEKELIELRGEKETPDEP